MIKFLWPAIALALAAGCGVPAERYAALKKQTDTIERNLDKIENGMDARVDSFLDSAEERLGSQLDLVRRTQADMGAQVEELNTTINNILGGNTGGEGMSAEVAQLNSTIAAIASRIDKLELLVIAGRGNNANMPALPKMKSSRYMWPTDRAGYEDGRTTYSLKNYTEAIDKLQEFLKVYPDSKYRPDAHYYLGESLLAAGKYLEAVVQFGEIIEKYPKSNKLAMAYLRAGMAYKKLNDKKKAKMFLSAVVKKFAGRPEADQAKKELRGL